MPLSLPPINPSLAVEALSYFISRSVERGGFSGVVLGLSGGVDSALVAALAVNALGSRRVTGLILPYRTSSPSSLKDARLVAKKLGIRTHTLDISDAVDGAARHLMVAPQTAYRARLGNIMARMRMIVLFDFSFHSRTLVIGTSNKSEIALGYATLFGDSASAINPIGDLYKTDVYTLARHLALPDPVLRKAPSADLWEGQTDEGEIGFRYADLDPVLYALLDLRIPPEKIVTLGADERLVLFAAKKVLTMHYKRKIPIIAKIERRTFGVDVLYAKDILT